MTQPLFPHQGPAVDAALACIQRGRHAVLDAPTGFGKTRVMVEIAKVCISSGMPVAFTVHRHELLRQAVLAFRAEHVPCGMIAPGHAPTSHPVHVAMMQTISRRGDSLDGWRSTIRVAMPDESHHCEARTFAAFLDSLPPGHVRIGATATPWRPNGGPLGGGFEEVICTPSSQQLADDGWLSQVRCFAPPYGDAAKLRQASRAIAKLKKARLIGGDYKLDDLAEVMDTPAFNLAAVRYYAQYMAGEPALVWCSGVEHARHVARYFTAAGWRAAAVWGDMDRGERERILARHGALARGDVHVVCFSDLIGEGVDIPAVVGLIMLRPTKSLLLYKQVVGRIRRAVYAIGRPPDTIARRLAEIAASWKPIAILIDQADNLVEHGLPDEPVPWTLARGIIGIDRTRVEIRRCGSCFCVFPAGGDACPSCGAAVRPADSTHKGPPGWVRGYSPRDLERMPLSDVVRVGRTYWDFLAIAEARGNSREWAMATWKAQEEAAQATLPPSPRVRCRDRIPGARRPA